MTEPQDCPCYADTVGVVSHVPAQPYKPPQNYCEQCKQTVNWNPCVTDGEAINCILAQQSRKVGPPWCCENGEALNMKVCPDCADACNALGVDLPDGAQR